MYQVIQPIIANPIYHITLESKPSIEELRIIYNFVNNIPESGFKYNEFLRLINFHPQIIGPLLDVLPFSHLIKLVMRYDFFHNYWDDIMINRIIGRTNKRLENKIIAEVDYTNELINLNNMFNIRYNFTDKYFLPRWYNYLTDYYIGTNMVLFLACHGPIHEPKFIIYPRLNKIELTIFSTREDYISTAETIDYIIVSMTACIFYIRKFCYPDMETLLFTTKEGIIIDIDNIWCKAETYQLFDGDLLSNVSHIQDTAGELFTFSTRIIPTIKRPKIKPTICYTCKRIYDPIYRII